MEFKAFIIISAIAFANVFTLPVKAFRQELASIKFVDIPNNSVNSSKNAESIEEIELKQKEDIKQKKKSKHKRHKRQKIKVASEQKLGPMTLDLMVNPFNRRRNQASFNLDLIESYEIATHKKEITYDLIQWQDIKKLGSYLSRERVSSLIAVVRDEFREVE